MLQQGEQGGGGAIPARVNFHFSSPPKCQQNCVGNPKEKNQKQGNKAGYQCGRKKICEPPGPKGWPRAGPCIKRGRKLRSKNPFFLPFCVMHVGARIPEITFFLPKLAFFCQNISFLAFLPLDFSLDVLVHQSRVFFSR